MAAVRFAVILKTPGLNILRCAGVKSVQLCTFLIWIRDTKQAVANHFNELYTLFTFFIVKEQILPGKIEKSDKCSYHSSLTM